MSVQIRRARPEDALRIAKVHIQSWQETYKSLVPQSYLDTLPQELEERIELWDFISKSTEKILFVAEVDGQIVGFAGFSHPREATLKEYGELGAIYLLKEFQGKGIGFSLMRAGFQELMKWNYHRAYCWVMKENPTLKFYLSTGARLNGMERDDEVGGAITRDVIVVWESLDSFR